MPHFYSAALRGLYGAHRNSTSSKTAGRSSASHSSPIRRFQDLSHEDVQLLAHVLRDVPRVLAARSTSRSSSTLETSMTALPRHLRVSSFKGHSSKALCLSHSQLNAVLVSSTWKWLKHELDGAIGSYIFPVLAQAVASGDLTPQQVLMARQLEPVTEMYRVDFSVQGATLPGHEAVSPRVADAKGRWVRKFGFQGDKCRACIIARMASDADVVGALFAGLVARMPSKHVGTEDELRSKRVLFVASWLRAFQDGSALFQQFWALGKTMRSLRKRWEREREEEMIQENSKPGTDVVIDEKKVRDLSAAKHSTIEARSKSVPEAAIHQIRFPFVNDDEQDSVINFDLSDPFDPMHRIMQHKAAEQGAAFDLSEPYSPFHAPDCRPIGSFTDLQSPTSIYSRTMDGKPLSAAKTCDSLPGKSNEDMDPLLAKPIIQATMSRRAGFLQHVSRVRSQQAWTKCTASAASLGTSHARFSKTSPDVSPCSSKRSSVSSWYPSVNADDECLDQNLR